MRVWHGVSWFHRASVLSARHPAPGTMAGAPNTAPLAGLAGHVSRTAAGVIKWPRQAEYDVEAWKAVRDPPTNI
eukprot:scaffold21588_cov135-Isochrysis_galbana.AAC.6